MAEPFLDEAGAEAITVDFVLAAAAAAAVVEAALEELLLFLVLDVFKCMGPVLEVLGVELGASGSILRADLALATMPVLMEPDFT